MINVEKMINIKNTLQGKFGEFSLFALFLREDAPGKWDLVVAAPWVQADKQKALRLISERISSGLSKEELLELSRIVILDDGAPGWEAILSAVSVSNGSVDIRDSNFFGLQIKHAIIFESKRLPPTGKQANA